MSQDPPGLFDALDRCSVGLFLVRLDAVVGDNYGGASMGDPSVVFFAVCHYDHEAEFGCYFANVGGFGARYLVVLYEYSGDRVVAVLFANGFQVLVHRFGHAVNIFRDHAWAGVGFDSLLVEVTYPAVEAGVRFPR